MKVGSEKLMLLTSTEPSMKKFQSECVEMCNLTIKTQVHPYEENSQEISEMEKIVKQGSKVMGNVRMFDNLLDINLQ